MIASPRPRFTPEEYLAIDRSAEHPSEYHDGELFLIEAATLRHAWILTNLGRCLGNALQGKPCRAGTQPRVRISARHYVYPDLAIVCGKAETFEGSDDILTNPIAIAEILSPSTADYDYGGKFALYRQLPSLREYILVSQTEPKVETFERTDDGAWLLRSVAGIGNTVKLPALEIELPLAGIFEAIEFPEESDT